VLSKITLLQSFEVIFIFLCQIAQFLAEKKQLNLANYESNFIETKLYEIQIVGCKLLSKTHENKLK
jgi:hypothetical protein